MTFRPPKRSVAWRRQEEKLDNEGQKQQPGSGNGRAKGDNKGKSFLIQCKTTAKGSTILKLDELLKMIREARQEDRIAVTQQQFKDQAKFAILRWEDFEGLVEELGMEL